MFGKGIKLFTILGFEVRADFSWLIIAFLVTWSLAVGYFPSFYQGLSQLTFWILGLVGALGLFTSIIFHELSHSLVARRFGMPIKGITLFVFGGVSQMEDEPPSSKAEFFMAAAGPLSSIGIGLFFFLTDILARAVAWPVSVIAVVNYLWVINWLLAAFNLVPAFPLDGGRILRAGLWKWKNNAKWATKIASRIGMGFGFFLLVVGFVFIFSGLFITGIWWILIGLFLQNAANMSYQRFLMIDVLKGEPVSRFMKRETITVPPDLPVSSLVDDYVYKYHYKMYPVVKQDELVGCVTTEDIKKIDREEWDTKQVEDIITACSTENTIGPDEDATRALQLMSRSNSSRLLVLKDGHLEGIIALRDLLHLLSLKLDLEEEEVKRNL